MSDNSVDAPKPALVKSNSSAAIRHPLEPSTGSPPLSPQSSPQMRRGSSPPSTSSNAASPRTPLHNKSRHNQSPSPSANRNSVMENLNHWISDLNTSIKNLPSPTSFLHNINPFSRKNKPQSKSSPMPSPLAVPRSRSEAITPLSTSSKSDENKNGNEGKLESSSPTPFDDPSSAKFLHGTLIPTLKTREVIELANVGVVEVEKNDEETGVGHDFKPIMIINATFCDTCGELVWTPENLDNCINSSLHFENLQCANCKYVCHIRCRPHVRIDCQGPVDSGTMLSGSSDDETRTVTPAGVDQQSELLAKIEKFNSRIKNKGSGLGMTILDNGTFRGFIRVHLNLTRPINVVAGTRPPSIYDIIKDDEEAAKESRRTLTSFYMPRDTVKNIHITSENTSIDVIKSMLKKFKVVDNPQKFALYKCTFSNKSASQQNGNSSKTNGASAGTMSGRVLKRIADHDKPLRIALDWLDSDDKMIVLQENESMNICWDAFALPELQNFLCILDKEEKEYMMQIKDRYSWIKNEMNQILNVKLIQSEGVLV